MIPKFRARDEQGNWHVGLLTFMFGQYAIVNEADGRFFWEFLDLVFCQSNILY